MHHRCQTAAGAPVTLEGVSVLVVEDEPILNLALEDMLFEAGAKPLMAQTLSEAWTILERDAPTMALLDINICGDLSYGLADALVARGIPFVFATGYGNSLHAIEFGDVPTISKPYSFPEVAHALRRLQG